MFGLVVPGREVQTDFVEGGEGRWLVDVPGPGEIAELCVFLAQPLAVTGVAVGVYFSFPPFQDYEFLGVLTNSRPSWFFSTGWALHPDAQTQGIARIGLCVEPEEALLEKMKTMPPTDFKKEYGRKIALNLFNFIESFRESGESALVSRPDAVLQTWLTRFEDKYRLDPNFVMRSE